MARSDSTVERYHADPSRTIVISVVGMLVVLNRLPRETPLPMQNLSALSPHSAAASLTAKMILLRPLPL